MKSKLFTPRFIFITSAILVAAVSRLFPHIPNFTPVAAMALFGGAYFTDKRMAILMPMAVMFLSDVALELLTGWGFHDTMIYVYVAFALTSLIGMRVGRNVSVLSVAGGALASSVLFFIITNFGVWAASGFQAGIAGLNTTYLLGIPYFAPTVAGDLLFNTVLFGAFYLVQNRYPALVKVARN
jgi:hypothetical protein